MTRALVVDDEVKLQRLIAGLFEEQGWDVETATRAEDAIELLRREQFELLVTDVRLPRASGIDLLREALTLQPELQAIVITAYGSVSGAVEAMRLGAFDYLLKPFEMEGLLLIARKALEAGRLRRENAYLRSRDQGGRPGYQLVADSPPMQQVVALVDKVAGGGTTVLITGESGVGKELVADTIHRGSPRRDHPLVRVNCPAIPRDLVESELFGHTAGAFTGASGARRGKFELADGGTLFLDEVGDLPLEQQGKLLHVLENRRFNRVGSSREIDVDVRILAATNRDLAAMVEAGTFRRDLYYRLDVFPIEVPPLRQREEDLPGLIDELLARLAASLGRATLSLAPAAMPVLCAYPWPGNVRELRNVLERAAVLCHGGRIEQLDLPAEIIGQCGRPDCACAAEGAGTTLHEGVERYKVQAILTALRACGWVKKDAAARLGLTPRALSHYLARYELERYRGEG